MANVIQRSFTQLGHMNGTDALQFGAALLLTLSVGVSLLILFFKVLSRKYPSPEVGDGANQAAGGGHTPGQEGQEGKKTTPKMPTKIPRPKRNIPPAAANALLEKGHRLRKDDEPGEALRCYLALLYAAIEEGGNLPSHLTDCLRGAAECYKALDKYDDAVRFLQAERMVYEEMVAQEQKIRTSAEGGSEILKSLFAGQDPTHNKPHRCEVLNGVAEASLQHGYSELGLSYRVKAAALKHRLGGKPLNPDDPDLAAIATALDQLEQKAAAAQEAGSNEPTGSALSPPPAQEVPAPAQPPVATASSGAPNAKRKKGSKGTAAKHGGGASNADTASGKKGKADDGADADAE